MKRRLYTLFGVLAALMVAMTAFAVTSWAAGPPAWTVPANGTLSTHMNTNLQLSGEFTVTSPQGEDLAIFVHANHGSFKSTSNPNNNICPLGVIPNGTFCSFSDPTVGQVNWNFRGTLAQVSQALNNVTYIPELNWPTPASGTLIDSVLISATEQNIAVGLTGSTNFEVEVLPANLAPTFATFPTALGGLETDANQNRDLLNQIDLNDPDLYTCDSTTDAGRTVLLTATAGGTWTTSYSSASFQVVGNGTPVLAMTGDEVDLNNALNSTTYHVVPFLAYDDPITVHYDDNGCVGYPGQLVVDGAFVMHVKPLAANHLAVTAPATATTGVPFGVTVQALDQYDNVDPLYTGTVHLTTSDGAGTLHADSMLVGGTAVLSGNTLNTVGNQTITATDTANASIMGTSGTIVVADPQVVTHFSVTAPATRQAGVIMSVVVTALDASNVIVPTYAGTVHFTSTDPAADIPADVGLAAGTGSFPLAMHTAGNQTYTATDTVTPSITGTTANILITPAPATHFSVTAPANAVNGTAITVGVTALDQYNNVDTNYAGTVHFTSTDGAAALPANATLTMGTGSFGVTLNTNGNQTVTATDTVTASINGTSGMINVSNAPPPPATHFSVTAPANATAGSSFTVNVTALTAGNATATGYSGTVHFSSTDGAAMLPADATLVNGVGSFSATLNTGGNQTITATDTVTASINGTSGQINVTVPPGPATHFAVVAPANATAGTSFQITITAQDAANATATGYSGTVHFTSTDGAATVPSDATLVNGTANFSVTMRTVGSWTVTGTDTVTASITGTSGTVTVVAGVATHFNVTAPPTATNGAPVNVIVTALDAFGNTATGYAGMAHFTSTDGAATLPADTTLTNGVGTFPVTFATNGNQTVTATDTVSASINGVTGSVNVSAAPPTPATHFLVSAPGNATAGVAFSVTVTALDAANMPTTGYAGTVHFTSTDANAVLPADATLTNGVGVFSATLKTAGSRTITATDTLTSSIADVSDPIDVVAAAPSQFKVSPPPGGTETGTAFSFTVTVVDQFGNTVTSYSGTVHFASSDPNAILPADAPLVNGVGTFQATFLTGGSQSLSVSDSQAELSGESTPVVIVTTTTTSTTSTSTSTSTTTPGSTTSTTAAGNDTTTTAGDVIFTEADPGVSSTGSLPVTGSNVAGMAWLGGVLLAGGLVLLLAVRRRAA